jgi:flagellar export protein FliJ
VHGRYDLQLQARLQSLTTTKGDLNQELQRRQIALVTAETEVKRFEKLEAREQTIIRQQRLRRDQAELDDATQSRTIMGRMRQ